MTDASASKSDINQSLRFLAWAHPQGPWTLTSIPVEGGRTFTATFHDLDAAKGWMAEKSGHQNIYWTVNRLRGPMDIKPKKEHIEEAVFLHVDLDPRKPADGLSPEKLAKWNADEQARILRTLEEFSPSPSAITFSGGGYQAFWRLDDPLYVGGDDNRIADLEAYNKQLAIVLGGDNTHNIDRIMRVPGTINVPDEKKRKKGRVEALATVVELSDVSYPLHDFTPAPEVQSTKSFSPNRVQISGNLPRLKDLDELPEAVTQRTRMLIVQGDDPDDPTRYGSKSEVMWAVTCELVRSGCEDDMIASVLLDPDFGVSDHPLRQKRSVEYVARQIERAREEVIEPMLRKLNEQHAVIADLGGKCRIISEVLDQNLARPRTRISKQSFEDFRNRYMHIKVQTGISKDGNPTYAAAGKWWLEHPLRRQFETLVFAPGRDVPDAFNLWRGFGCEASRVTITAEQVVDGYALLFDPLTRAAHFACLERARLTRKDGWPSVADCLAFAHLYDIEAAPFAAFFGYLGWTERSQMIWVDALDGGASVGLARQRSTDGQARAFGFLCALSGEMAAETRH